VRARLRKTQPADVSLPAGTFAGDPLYEREDTTGVQRPRGPRLTPFGEVMPNSETLSRPFWTRGSGRARVLVPTFLLLGTIVALAGPLSAQGRGGPAGSSGPGSSPDFLPRRPSVSLALKGGMFLWNAEGQLYDFTLDRFTAERSDFRGPAVGFELGFWPRDRWGLTVGVEGAGVSIDTEDRDWVELDGTPIYQTTRLREGASLHVGGRFFLLPMGEQVSRLAWVPARLVPFLSAGVGFSTYSFEQEGDFVDETGSDVEIFSERFLSEGSAILPWVGGGLDLTLLPRLLISVEGRYQGGSDSLDGDFRAFEPIDLGGLRVTAGISFRF